MIHTKNHTPITHFAAQIITWYKDFHRELPWRATQDPYKIWLSEIILQQTRVKQGLPYYEKFVETYPTIADFASADLQDILRLWQGLGYYSRARNMHYTAKFIQEELGGNFPNTYQDLLKLKGVGKYTAAAIASFAFGEDVAVLDGNVFRLLARYFGIDTDISSGEGQKEFLALAQAMLPQGQSALYNQALMEFGAMQCSPQKPNCMYCPLQADCVAFATDKIADLPVKNKKMKQKERFFHYWVIIQGQKIALRHRSSEGIWEGLYDFYLQEEDKSTAFEEALQQFPSALQPHLVLKHQSPHFKHILTHQIIQACFWQVEITQSQLIEKYLPMLNFYSIEEIKDLPKPILIHNYLEKYFF